jgi:hypothetical protein
MFGKTMVVRIADEVPITELGLDEGQFTAIYPDLELDHRWDGAAVVTEATAKEVLERKRLAYQARRVARGGHAGVEGLSEA